MVLSAFGRVVVAWSSSLEPQAAMKTASEAAPPPPPIRRNFLRDVGSFANSRSAL